MDDARVRRHACRRKCSERDGMFGKMNYPGKLKMEMAGQIQNPTTAGAAADECS